VEIRRINIRQGNNRLCIICIDVQYALPAISQLFQKLIVIHVLIYTIVDICCARIDFLTQYRIDVQYHEKSISMQKKSTIACISRIYQNDINITSMLEINDNMFRSVDYITSYKDQRENVQTIGKNVSPYSLLVDNTRLGWSHDFLSKKLSIIYD